VESRPQYHGDNNTIAERGAVKLGELKGWTGDKWMMSGVYEKIILYIRVKIAYRKTYFSRIV
jgi:hypothetical protein